ncbi:MAG: hypothetical protein EPO32_07605 [Anaerolineae bacterium]|nr:MAG: hypothetical protein EPO32_07605 [Anaerolineae bacterium]
MTGLIGLIVFAALTALLWWALQNQLGLGAEAAHGHGEAPDHAAAATTDNLEKIEGIGPAIRKLLSEHGISSFAALANATLADLEKILQAGGSRFKVADAGSWPKQAALAAKGDWAGLKKLQDELTAGR